MTVMTNKERVSMAKSATAKTRLKVTHSVPVLPSGPVPQLAKTTRNSCSRRGASSPSSGAADHIFLQSGNPTSVCVNTHSLSSNALDQHPMNSVVIDTPEPYLEPIKTLSLPLGGGDSRLRSSRKHKRSVAVGLLPPEPADSGLDKKTLSPPSIATFYRPIPPPKVVLQIQRDRKENNRSYSSQRDEALVLRQKKKHSELAYLIVDLDSVGSPIKSDTNTSTSGQSYNQKAFDDSHLSVKTYSVEDNTFPIRSKTMSAKNPVRPRPPPRVRCKSSLTKDSLKDIPALPNELDKESKPSDSASAQERKPPPRRRPPPRPVVSKMISLPSYLSPTNRRSLGEERKTSLPLVSSKGNVVEDDRRRSVDSTGSLNSTALNGTQRETTTPKTPPNKPKPYSPRNSATPPPPSFRPPSPLTHVAHKRTSSFSKLGGESPDNTTTNKGLKDNYPDLKLKPNASPKTKPRPPTRPPPPNPKGVQKSLDCKLKSKSTSDVKQPQTNSNTRRSPAPAPRLQISEPQLISSTVSRTLSVSNIQDLKQFSPEAAAPLVPADYEDMDFDDDLPPTVPNKLSKPIYQSPTFGRKISTENPPDLPPRGSKTDPIARKIAVSPLFSSLSKSVVRTSQHKGEDSPYNPLVKVKPPTNSTTEPQDRPEPDYEKIDVSDDENEVSSSACEPDVGGIDDYVPMGSVLVSAWEDGALVSSVMMKNEEGKKELEEDNLDESYVEMHPADHSTLKEMANNDDEEDNLYWNEDPDDPIYIEMNPDVYIPAPDPAELHYASKNLLKERPDLQATKKIKTKPKPALKSSKVLAESAKTTRQN